MKRGNKSCHHAMHVSSSVHRCFPSLAHPRHLLPPPFLLYKIRLQPSLLLVLFHATSETSLLSLGRIYKTTSMASLFIAKGAVCSFSGSLKVPPLTSRLSGRRRATRLFTTSSSAPSDHADYDGVEGEEAVAEASERAKVTAREGAEKAKEKAAAAKDWTAEAAESAKEKTREGACRAAEKSGEVKDKTAETASNVTEKSKEGLSKTAETTKEAVQNLGEKAKQTVEGAWGAAKETTKKIKETVVGKDSTSELESEAGELEAARRRAAGDGKANRDID